MSGAHSREQQYYFTLYSRMQHFGQPFAAFDLAVVPTAACVVLVRLAFLSFISFNLSIKALMHLCGRAFACISTFRKIYEAQITSL